MKIIKKIFIFTFLLTLLIPGVVYAITSTNIIDLSDKINNKKDTLKSIETKLGEYKNKIDNARNQAVTLKNQIELINNQIVRTELEIEEAEVNISKLELEILRLNNEILDTEKKINLQKELSTYYFKELQRVGDKSPFEIILLNKSFSKFFKQIKFFEDIQSKLNRSIEDLRNLRNEKESQQKDLENFKNDIVKTKNNLEDDKERLDAQKVAKTFLIGQSYASESKFQALLADTQRQQEELDSEINRLESDVRKKLQENDLFLYNGDVVLTWPVPKAKITAYFNDPDYPYRYVFEHSGLDIRATQGTSLVAPAPGYVLKIRNQDSWMTYNYIVLVHAGGISTIYLHLSDVYVKADTYVSRGQLIGKTGGTPRTRGAGPFTTGPHLHFEVRQNGIPVNPLNYLVNL